MQSSAPKRYFLRCEYCLSQGLHVTLHDRTSCDFYLLFVIFIDSLNSLIVSIYCRYKQKHKIECEGPAQQQWGARLGVRATPPSGQPGSLSRRPLLTSPSIWTQWWVSRQQLLEFFRLGLLLLCLLKWPALFGQRYRCWFSTSRANIYVHLNNIIEHLNNLTESKMPKMKSPTADNSLPFDSSAVYIHVIFHGFYKYMGSLWVPPPQGFWLELLRSQATARAGSGVWAASPRW